MMLVHRAAETPATPAASPPPPPIPAPNAGPELAADETIINPHYMMQLLIYGLRMGERKDVDWTDENLFKEGEVRLACKLICPNGITNFYHRGSCRS